MTGQQLQQNTGVTPSELRLSPDDPKEREVLFAERQFALVQRQANLFASGDIVPKQFQGKLANCVIAMEMAKRLNAGPLEIMQNLYVVHGNPAFSSKYLIALVNSSGILKGRLKYEYFGEIGSDEYGCYAWGVEKETDERLEGPRVTIKMAKADGWYGKNGSKWQTLPDLMLMYRSAAFWSRVNAPEVTMGMMTHEEAIDVGEKDITPQKSELNVSDLNITPKSKDILPEAVDTDTGEVIAEQENTEVEQPTPSATGIFGSK